MSCLTMDRLWRGTVTRHAAVILAGLIVVTALNGVAAGAKGDDAGPGGTAETALYAMPSADPVERRALAQSRAANEKLLQLKAVVFDPVETGEPDFGELLPTGPELRSPSPGLGRVWLAQFDAPVTANLQRRLAHLGIEILSYVPNRALLVRLPAGTDVGLLRSAPEVRYVGPFLPGFKLEPELFHDMRAGIDDVPTVDVDVVLFRGEDPDPLAAAVEEKLETASVEFVERGSGTGLIVTVAVEELEPLVGALIRDPAVEHVARRLPLELHNDNSVWIGQSYDRVNGPTEAQAPDPKPYTQSATIWNRGLTGTGQVVAVADTGLEDVMCYFNDPAHPVVPQAGSAPGDIVVDPDHRKILAVNHLSLPINAIHGTFRHGSHTAGSVAGDNLANLAGPSSAGHDHADGMAPGAKLIIEDIGNFLLSDCRGAAFAFSQNIQLERQYTAGARISTNSYGSSTSSVYPTEASNVDSAVWQFEDFLVFYSAGNDGNQAINFVSGFSACKNCISVGATETYDPGLSRDPENMAAFSSRGTADGRYKPDITAPGVGVVSARYPSAYDPVDETGCFPAAQGVQDMCIPFFGGCYRVDTSDTCQALALSGTSMSSPTAAGLGALARQYFSDGFHPGGAANPANAFDPSAQLVKAVLLNGARNMTGVDRQGDVSLEDAPSSVQGWGRVLLDDALYFTGDTRRLRILDVPRANGLVTGNGTTTHFSVASPGEALKLTLVWTDPPASTSAGAALVNDLDLVLTAPDGTVYHGNQWSSDDINVPGDKQSQPNPAGSDGLNNVEGISIPSPLAGTYEVEVVGTDVPGGQGVFTQGFALVATGDVGACTATSATTMSVLNVASLSIDLQWNAIPGALGYTLYRNSSGCSDPQAADLVVPLSSSQTTYADTAVQAETLYTYTVRAVTSADGCETVDSNCVATTTLPPPTIESVDPDSGINNDPTQVTITGDGFRTDTRVFLGTDLEPEKHLFLPSVISGSEMQIVVPVNLLPGSYDVTVRNLNDGLEDTANDAFTVGGPLQTAEMYVAQTGPIGSPDDTIVVVDLDSFSLLPPLPTNTGAVNRDIVTLKNAKQGLLAIYGFVGGGPVIGVLDLELKRVDRFIPTTASPQAVTAHPNEQLAYVLVGASLQGTVNVIDLSTDTVVATIPTGGVWTPVPAREDIAISPDGAQVFVTSSTDHTVSIIRTSDNTEVARLAVGISPQGLAVSSDSTRLYVANLEDDTVSVIDTGALAVIDTIDVSLNMYSEAKALALSPDDSTLYVGYHSTYNSGVVAVDLSNGQLSWPTPTWDQWRQWWKLLYKEDEDKLYGMRWLQSNNTFELVRVDPGTLQVEAEIGTSVGRTLDFLEPDPIAATGVSPDDGCTGGGYLINVFGSGFQGEVEDDLGVVVQEGTRVFFGSNESPTVTLLDSTEVRALVPASTTGTGYVDVRVLNPNGLEDTLAGGFRYRSCGGGRPDPDFPVRPCLPEFPCHVQQVP